MLAFDNHPSLLNNHSILQRQMRFMKKTITKAKNQTIWYENDELIKEYVESTKHTLKLRAASRRERLSLAELIKKSMAEPID